VAMNRTDRLYALVEELRAVAPRVRSVRWLAQRFEVHARTIERDLSALQQAGVPIWATPGRHGGYALDPRMSLPPLNFTPAEAAAIAVAMAASRAGAGNPVRAGHAARSYSWRSPPRRSRRWMVRCVIVSGLVIGLGSGCSGRALAIPR